MPVYNPRTRLVNFRLSEDEFQSLKSQCATSGARSVSDYARVAVLSGGTVTSMALKTEASGSSCSDRWDRIESAVLQLESKLNRLIDKELTATNV